MKTTIAIIIFTSLLRTVAFAEIIYLKDGEVIHGDVKQTNKEGLQIRAKHGLLMVLKKDIERVEYTTEPTRSSTTTEKSEEPKTPEQIPVVPKSEVTETPRPLESYENWEKSQLAWTIVGGFGYHPWRDSSFFTDTQPLGPWFDASDFSGFSWNLAIEKKLNDNNWYMNLGMGGYGERIISTIEVNPLLAIWNKVIEDADISVFRILLTPQRRFGASNNLFAGIGLGMYWWDVTLQETNIDTTGTFVTVIANAKGNDSAFAFHLQGGVDFPFADSWIVRIQDTYSFGPNIELTVFPANQKLGEVNFGGNVLAINIGYRF